MPKLDSPESIVEAYLHRMAEIADTGASTAETSFYSALENLSNAVGKSLSPRVICNGQLRDQGAGHPDFGLYTQQQCKRGTPKEGEAPMPERGVVEVKAPSDDTLLTADTDQVTRYWRRYGLVLVTNYRDFVLIGMDANGRPVRLESFSLADDAEAFWDMCARPRRGARQRGPEFVEYLKRALVQQAPLSRPADLAWLLASYARDALARVERRADLPAIGVIRGGLEQALGMKFEGERGEHFFRSTLVQTLFYGIFSAWVQWSKHRAHASGDWFDWRDAAWSLHVPMVRSLFEQVATPSRLGPLDLVEVLDWTGDALNRVDRKAFFAAFDQGRAVQYFYEPFLANFDPELRKQLGVWYTPPEVVRYMVARVDQALQDELGIADGLADPNVYVLDPCCGTGSFVVETLNVIAERLHRQGSDALLGQELKEAATSRVFGFEIMPAPFVIAHWQVGMRLADAEAPLASEAERACVYLTNALTGWQPADGPKQDLPFPELEEERDAAEHVKRDTPILVVIGNPPYNAFAGTSPAEEEGLVEPYKEGLIRDWGIRKFNIDELYVRFLRVAERRIVEQTGRGIVSFISSYSYLSDPSFVVLRKHLLDGFDTISIDSLNGDSRETGKLTPEGEPDPSIFSTEYNRVGIRLGTAVGTFVRSGQEDDALAKVRYRDFWGKRKRDNLLASLEDNAIASRYALANPSAHNRYDLRPWSIAGDYELWPALREIALADSFSGLQEMRKGALISIDANVLAPRIQRYLNPKINFSTLRDENCGPVQPAGRFDPKEARNRIINEEGYDPKNIRRYTMYPLDNRWCYHSGIRPIWNEPRPELAQQMEDDNLCIVTRMSGRQPKEGVPIMATRSLPNYHLLDPNAHAFPIHIRTRPDAKGLFSGDGEAEKANLSERVRSWLADLGRPVPDNDSKSATAPWLHALAIGFAPAWLEEHKAAIFAGWPRVPLPATAADLSWSAELGARLAALLDPDRAVPSVTGGTLVAPFRVLGAMARVDGKGLKPEDLALTAGWGRGGGGKPVMPGNGRTVTRERYSEEEHAQIDAAAVARGEATVEVLDRLGPPIDIWLNDTAYWRAVPKAVWEFRIGGYQVFKKWLSYREKAILGRPLTTTEAQEASAIVRRLTAIVLMRPELDANYRRIRDNCYPWHKAIGDEHT